jgi:hypothetical protein
VEKPSARLSSNHLKELRRSGLSDATIKSWGCFSIGPKDKHLLKGFAKGVEPPGLALPILPPGALEPVGFIYKPDNPRTDKKNDKVRIRKYEMARNALNHIHVPLGAQHLFQPTDGVEGPRRIVVTEGMKKAEKAVQEGIPTIALLGVDNWRQNFGGESMPIEEITRIEWPRFKPEICFDSDAATNQHVRRAERALGKFLCQRGAKKVAIVRLPPGDDGSKVGLDDYLLNHTAAEFEALPRLPVDVEPSLEDLVQALTKETEKIDRNQILGRIISEEHDPSERERLFKIVARGTGISLRSLRRSAEIEAARIEMERRQKEANLPPATPEEMGAQREKVKEQQRVAIETILSQAKNTVKLRAQTSVEGQLTYIAAFGGAGSVLLSSTGVALPLAALPLAALPEGCEVTEPPPDRSPLTPRGIQQFQEGAIVDGIGLFKDVRDFFRDHVVFKHPCVPAVLALWVMATYCYASFNYFGYIWLTSVGPACGKSLVAKMLSMLCFNATPPMVDPTPATVFRDIEANSSTLVLDEVENLDPEKKAELISLLNAGFERGGQVARMIPAADGWKRQTFDVYSPKIIAGINQIPRVLQTRVLHIEMRKKKPTEKRQSFKPDRQANRLAKIRDDSALFALRNAPTIAQMYEARDELVPTSGHEGKTIFDDRLRDILAPIYALAAVVDHQAGDLIATLEVNRFAELQAGARNSDSAGDYALAVHAVFEWAETRWQDGEVLIRTDEAVDVFRAAEIEWALSRAKALDLLRKLGGRNIVKWRDRKTQRGYIFVRAELQDLVERNPICHHSQVSVAQKA